MYYKVKFNKSKVVHAAQTKNASLGSYFGDSLFGGGGITLVCGIRECSGKATLWEPHQRKEITCKICLSKLGRKKLVKSIIMPLKRAIRLIDKAIGQNWPINREAWQSVRTAAIWSTCSLYGKCPVLKGKDAARFLREKFKAEQAPITKKMEREFKRAKEIYEAINRNSEDKHTGEHSHPDFFKD
jgi:hypothetical protein